VFENDEHVVNFLSDLQPTSSNFPVNVEIQTYIKDGETHQKTTQKPSCAFLPKNYVSLESLFTRDDQTKKNNTIDEPSLRKVQETQKINIATSEAPKYINLGTSCTTKEMSSTLFSLKNLGCFCMDL
jgi:hypothetical protein